MSLAGYVIDHKEPRNGPINKLRLNAKYKYKTAIKQAALSFEWDLDDELSELYLRKDVPILEKLAKPLF